MRSGGNRKIAEYLRGLNKGAGRHKELEKELDGHERIEKGEWCHQE